MSGKHYKSLIKNLDLFYFWEPFEAVAPGREIALREMLQAFADIRKKAKRHQAKFEQIKIPVLTKTLLFAYETINQREALKPVMAAFSEESEILESLSGNKTIPIIFLESLGLGFKYELLRAYFTFKGRQRSNFQKRFYTYFSKLGTYNYLKTVFENSPDLKYYIGSNDHSGFSQTGFVAAKAATESKLKTIYIQHASVSDKFPPLTVDYALLDGQDAKDKYLAAGLSHTEIFLVGTMKYDAYLQSEKLEKPGKLIAVCVGTVLQNLEEILVLCRLLEDACKPFCLRFHPALNAEVRQRFTSQNWPVSNPEEETALDFIFRCHTVISGDSNILLEAIILKRRPVYFASQGNATDYYGFVKNGAIESACLKSSEVMTRLETPFDLQKHRLRAKHYHHGLYSKNEGNTTAVVVQTIREITGI